MPSEPAVLSPCIGVCELDERGLCRGCRRSAAEIADWLRLSEDRRRQLMDEVLPARGAGTGWAS